MRTSAVLLSFIIFVIAGILGLTMPDIRLAQQPLPMSVRVQSVPPTRIYTSTPSYSSGSSTGSSRSSSYSRSSRSSSYSLIEPQ